MKEPCKTPIRILLLGACCVVASACGGDSGQHQDPASDDDVSPLEAPSAPASLRATYGIGTYHFVWDESPGATSYELLRDADGVDPGTAAVITTGLPIASATYTPILYRERAATYTVRACNAAGCGSPTAPFTPDLVSAIGYIKASNSGTGDTFGTSLAFSADGSTMAVGAPIESDAGAVYIFDRDSNGWAERAYVQPSTVQQSGFFGVTLALSADGNTLVIGSPGVNHVFSGTPVSDVNIGATFVFNRENGAWTESAILQASDASGRAFFGRFVAVSDDGHTIAAAANGREDSVGAVYVFVRDSGEWEQQGPYKADDASTYDYFGTGLALSGDGSTMAVGASGAGPEPYSDAGGDGAAYIFARDTNGWSQIARLASPSAVVDMFFESFGTALTLSRDGQVLAVGAYGGTDDTPGINTLDTGDAVPYVGAVYVYERDGNALNAIAHIKASNTGSSYMFGRSVALSADGTTLLVGAPSEHGLGRGLDAFDTDDYGSGAAYVFTRSEGIWTQTVQLKASNTDRGDEFGESVALAADASVIGIAAPSEDSNAKGLGGSQTNNWNSASGAVYLY